MMSVFLFVCILGTSVIPFARATPEITSVGSSMQLKLDDGGDLQVVAGSMAPQSIPTAISRITEIQDNISMAMNSIRRLNSNISSVASSLSVISGIQNNISSIGEAISLLNQTANNVSRNSMQRANVMGQNISLAADRIALLEASTNCQAGILTSDAIPLNSEPIPTAGMCNLTLGGTCRVMCKQGYRANSSINVAFQKTAVGFLRTDDILTDANRTLDGRTGDWSRYVAQCARAVCWVVVDLHQPYMITEFNWLNGHGGCVPGARTCNYDAHCKHYVQVWTGPEAIPGLRTIGADTSANWTTIVSHLQPSSHGVIHDAFAPVNARYVKLLVDNRRDVATCYGGSYLRIREIQVLTSSTKAYTCTAAGLVPVDGVSLECDVTNGTIV
eukprot:m.400183 g.400183  ORF g.400183 m.400183 type:complete len:387 (+) comp21157_c0_seq20:224-1384(+)